MNFSAWSIRNPVAPLLAFALLLVLGWTSFNRLPITRFPSIDVPLVAVSVVQAGAAPSELEAQVTQEVEDAVTGLSGVKNVSSTVSDSVSTTLVEFRMETPTDQALQDVKDAMDGLQGRLPADAETPSVIKIDIEGIAIMNFAVQAPGMTFAELSTFVDDVIVGDLQGRPGVGRVDRYGGADREILVELDPGRLDAYGVTASAVSQQLRLTNANQGAGRAEIGGAEQTIRVVGDRASVADLAATTIALPTGQQVRLDQIGTITDTTEEVRSQARVNGEEAVVFAVFKSKGASEVSAAETVNAALDDIRAAHPDVEITLVDDTVFYTYGNYKAALHTLIEGSILAVLVVLAFLRNWRATAIAAVALPLSAIPTFWVMDLLGFSLNLVSFLAITLATGILVDDAIVEIENIQRHIRMGKSPYRASIDAADEIGLAVIATTFTIVAVFTPVAFMPGIPGQYFRQFGLTVAISVLFSLMVARLITPLMTAYLMRASDADAEHKGDGAFMRGYLRLVRTTTAGRIWLIPARYLTLVGAVGVLAVSVHFMLKVPGAFLPPEDLSRITLSVELPPGVSLDDTDAATRAIAQRLEPIEGVDKVFVLNGSSPTGDRETRRATVNVILEKLDSSLERKLLDIAEAVPGLGAIIPEVAPHGRIRPQWDIETEVFAAVADIPDVRVMKLDDRGSRAVTYSILSSDSAALEEAVRRLEQALVAEQDVLANVSTEGALPRAELQVIPRFEEAARMGVTPAAISQTMRVATLGDVDAALAKVSIDGTQVPIRVQLDRDARTDVARLSALRVPTATGGSVPLNAVADLVLTEGPSTIERLNGDRQATIGADLPQGVALGTATERFKQVIDSVELPDGVRVAESGDAEVQGELFASFGNAMILGLMLVLTVLILLFKSVIQPFTILLSLPLAIGGVAAALILTNSALSMPVLIGILMLMGIVTKNAILLVDFAIEMKNRGLDRFSAVVEAGHKRAQPIVMTSIAMSAGMLPSALGVGEGGAFRAPMATAVIGGIIVSTVLSLVVVPAFFLVMDDLQRLMGWVFSGLVGQKEDERDMTDEERRLDAVEARLEQLEGVPPRQAPRLAAE